MPLRTRLITTIRGALLDANHPTMGVNFACRSTAQARSTGRVQRTGTFQLGSVAINLELRRAAQAFMIAGKLRSVLSVRRAMRRKSFRSQKTFLNRCHPPFVHLAIDSQGSASLGRCDMQIFYATRIPLFDDPIAVERLVSQECIERQAVDQGRDTTVS